MDLKLNKLTNDLLITSGDFETVSGIDEQGQRIKDRLLTFRNEWFLDLSYGVDYINRIFKKSQRQSIISAHLRSEILKSAPGKITSFSANLKDRNLSVTYGVLIEGETLTDEVSI